MENQQTNTQSASEQTSNAQEQVHQQTPPQGETSAKSETKPQGEHGKVIAILAYILFFIPLLTEYRKDPFVSFHTSQGFVLFIAYLICTVVSAMPFIGLISIILYPVLFVFMIIGIINAAQGRQKELPFIGHYGRTIHF